MPKPLMPPWLRPSPTSEKPHGSWSRSASRVTRSSRALALTTGMALIGLAATACSTRTEYVQVPIFIPPLTQETCLPPPLPDEHFETWEDVNRRVAEDGLELAGAVKKCDDKRQALITAIVEGQKK